MQLWKPTPKGNRLSNLQLESEQEFGPKLWLWRAVFGRAVKVELVRLTIATVIVLHQIAHICAANDKDAQLCWPTKDAQTRKPLNFTCVSFIQFYLPGMYSLYVFKFLSPKITIMTMTGSGSESLGSA